MSNVHEIISKIKGKSKAKPIAEFKLNYDSMAETLEPVYFWILDFLQDKSGGLGLEVEKLTDNFTASPGSGYFADIGVRATRMQEQGMKMLGTINTVMRSILNLIYDLKEFEIRLQHYDAAKSKDKEKQETGIFALKQIWMDRVDIKRGAGSINLLTQQLDFVTLRDAFIRAKNIRDIDSLDLNERVKRILKPRIAEFLEWRERSERELRNRFEIERAYLASQVNAIKLYTRWVKPYLRAAEELGMMKREMSRADLVTAFNTVIMELSIFGKKTLDTDAVRELATSVTHTGNRDLPERFKSITLKRPVHVCVFVEFLFRGLPRVAQRAESTHYVHSGKASVVFKSYVLNDDELKLLHKEIAKEDIFYGLKLVEGLTGDGLEAIQTDLEKYMKGESQEKKEARPRRNFLEVLFGLSPQTHEKKSKKITETEELKKARKENFVEKQIRKYAERRAKSMCYATYDVYKKGHGMASLPPLHN